MYRCDSLVVFNLINTGVDPFLCVWYLLNLQVCVCVCIPIYIYMHIYMYARIKLQAQHW